MAVVQISRIQIRRGQQNNGTGLPQLASGEMAWAIDTQQLYIGNGAVSEGAPAVGNTKILTQNDLSSQGNLLGLLQYVYKTNDTSIVTGVDVNHPISRSLQDRLDDRISTIEFGSVGDGTTNDTAALQRAISELFLNPNNKASNQTNSAARVRVTLAIPAGVYYTDKPLYIPSYATLVGDGAEKTIIYYNPVSTLTVATINNSPTVPTAFASSLMVGATVTGSNIPANTTISSVTVGVSITLSAGATSTLSNASITITLNQPAVQFISDTSTITNAILEENNSGDDGTVTLGVYQPKNIYIGNLTIHTPTGQNTCLQLNEVKDSIFENINLQGDVTTSNASSVGIIMRSFSSLVTCDHNVFRNVKIYKFSTAVYASQDIINNNFRDCLIDNSIHGFILGEGTAASGNSYGPRETVIDNCKFNNVKQHGVFVNRGSGNTVSNCKFINVGCNGGGVTSAQYPVVYFATPGNTVNNIYTDRQTGLSTTNLNIPYVPELGGHGVYSSFGASSLSLSQTVVTTLAFRLPCASDQFGAPASTINYDINYYYVSSNNNFSRKGTISLVADWVRKRIQLSDEFNFAGNDAANTTCLLLEFSATFLDQTGNTYTGSAGQVASTIAINYVDNLNGDVGYFEYSYTSIS